MTTVVHDPLDVRNGIVEFAWSRRTEAEPVLDRDVAAHLGVDLPTLRVHLEMLATERRIDVVRGEESYGVVVTEEQWGRHASPPVHVVLRERLEGVGRTLDRLQHAINRVVAWAPVVLTIAAAAVGWFGSAPAVRSEHAFYAGVFGLLVGVILRREFTR